MSLTPTGQARPWHLVINWQCHSACAIRLVKSTNETNQGVVSVQSLTGPGWELGGLLGRVRLR